MEWTKSLKRVLKETAQTLKGEARRRFMAQIVLELGVGGQTKAEQELGWNRRTIRKGIKEVTSGIICVDNYQARGRKKAESHLPKLLENIESIVDNQSQTDPSFKSKRLYTRLSACQVRKQLISQYGFVWLITPLITVNIIQSSVPGQFWNIIGMEQFWIVFKQHSILLKP
jgi:hypothetical protein